MVKTDRSVGGRAQILGQNWRRRLVLRTARERARPENRAGSAAHGRAVQASALAAAKTED